jgi:hypothetical protein
MALNGVTLTQQALEKLNQFSRPASLTKPYNASPRVAPPSTHSHGSPQVQRQQANPPQHPTPPQPAKAPNSNSVSNKPFIQLHADKVKLLSRIVSREDIAALEVQIIAYNMFLINCTPGVEGLELVRAGRSMSKVSQHDSKLERMKERFRSSFIASINKKPLSQTKVC